MFYLGMVSVLYDVVYLHVLFIDNIYTKECELAACITTIQLVNCNRNTK